MSKTHVDAVAKRISPDAATFASLPLSLACRVFLTLPVEARGRACCVCRAWRDALAEPSLWSRLDMSGVCAEEERFVNMFRGAAGRARTQLCQLDISRCHVEMEVLLPVLTANAGSLRGLHLHTVCAYTVNVGQAMPSVEAVVAAAPLLQVLTVENARCLWEDAPRMLRREPPFVPLQMRRLVVHFSGADGVVGGMERFERFAAALADAALQPALLHVRVFGADTAQPALMGALADVALARRLRELTLDCCLPPAAAPLARLLTNGSLTLLEISEEAVTGYHTPLFDADDAALVAGALRVSTTLTTLKLRDARLCLDMQAAGLLLGALVGHPSLRELRITGELTARTEYRIAFGAALAALIAADAPALHIFDCSRNLLRDAALAPIVEALARNHHLRELDLHFNFMLEAFARDLLLPAVRANTTLRALKCECIATGPAAAEAEELVRRRAQHD